MLIGPDYTRPMNPGEEDTVDALLRASFDTHAQAQLVRKLRKSRVIAGEMVMPWGDDIVGYYALSYLSKPKGWIALAPLAIHPDHQGKGYGKRMVGMLSEWARLTQTPVIARGTGAFFVKGGFAATADDVLTIAGAKALSDTLPIYPAAFEVL